jgi:outer membrane biosynthesis protein TonB
LPVPQAEIAPIPPPKPAPKPEPKPAPEPAVIAQAPMPSEVARPKKKPAPPPPPPPPDLFASVLKSIEEMEVRAPKPDKPEPAETPPVASPAEDPVDQILARADSTFRPELGLSMSEIDNIRWQIQRNWNPPAGALDAAEMIVALRIQLRPDGSVSAVTIVDSGRINSDPFYRAMAESAVRAVKITGRIENLSAQKYDLWRDILINFDPREMYG